MVVRATHVLLDRTESDDGLEKPDQHGNDEDANVMPERAVEGVEMPPNFLGGLEYSISMHFVCIHKTLNFKSSFLN
jgi:hypothetical protein